MKRKFVKVMFFGALALSTVTYVGCKDYDDDINNLQTQIDANAASIADLQKFVNEGKWVKSVEDITGGFKITFSDGKIYSIVNGATGATGATGAQGAQGVQGVPGKSSTLTIDPVTGEWLIDNAPSGWTAKAPYIQGGYWYYWSSTDKKFVKGEKATGETGPAGPQGPAGINGIDGYSPYIADGTNGDKGYWYFYQKDHAQAITEGKLKGWVKGPLTDTSIFLTKSVNKPCWILKQQISEGVWNTVVLPTADNLTSIKGVAIEGNKITTTGTKEITLYYGIVEDEGVKFGDPEVAYEKGKLLTSNSSVINAMVNPTDIDLSQYTLKLQDSHGNTCYTLSAPEKNMSPNPLTRAAAEEKWNQGVYNLTVSLAEGVEANQIKSGVAYALSTQNAWDKTILSEYDVKVTPSTTAKSLDNSHTFDVAFNQLQDLDQLVIEDGEENLGFVAAYYYEFNNLPATVKFDKVNKTIISTIGQTVTGTLHYLKVNGKKGTTDLTLNFKSIAPVVTVPVMNWTIGTPNANAKIALPAEIKALMDDPSGKYSLVYASGDALGASAASGANVAFSSTDPVIVDKNEVTYKANSIKLAITNNGKTGADKIYYLTPTFDNATVTATAHKVKLVVKDATGSVLLGTDVIKTIDLTVNVILDKSKIAVFKPLTAFFDANRNAKGYGTPNISNRNVEYDLYTLFEVDANAKANISFETGTWAKSGSLVKVPYKDVSFGTTTNRHNLIIKYQPFGNTNLSIIDYEFTLAVWSEIEQGTHGTVSDKYLAENARIFNLNIADFEWKDYKGNALTLATESKITSITLALSAEAARYMSLDETDFKANSTIKVTMLDVISGVETEISGTDSYITMSVKDIWGVTTSVKIPVPVKKLEK